MYKSTTLFRIYEIASVSRHRGSAYFCSAVMKTGKLVLLYARKITFYTVRQDSPHTNFYIVKVNLFLGISQKLFIMDEFLIKITNLLGISKHLTSSKAN